MKSIMCLNEKSITNIPIAIMTEAIITMVALLWSSEMCIRDRGCTVTRHTGFIGIGVDIVQACTVENRSSEFQSQFFTGPAQYLSLIHIFDNS